MEARLEELSRPPKTPGNSSKPPSQGLKSDLPAPAADRPPRKGRPGVGRTLHPNPDRTIDRRLSTCPKCEAVFPDALQTLRQVYERIELPPVRPDVTQVRLFGGRCDCCGERVTAQAPAGLEQGSPFGHSIATMVVYLHYAHAIGMERLALLGQVEDMCLCRTRHKPGIMAQPPPNQRFAPQIQGVMSQLSPDDHRHR